MTENLKKAINFVLVLLIAISAGQFLGIPNGMQAVYANSPNAVTITIQNTVKDTITEGVGWNAEDVWSGENKVDGDCVWNDGEWARYNNIVSFLKPQLIRMGVSLPYWSPSYGTYTYNSNWMLNAYRQLDAFKEMDANVMWANWWSCSHDPDNYWWSEVTRSSAYDTNNNPRDDMPYDTAKFTEAMANCLEYLRNTKGYTNVKYASLWNEPNWSFNSQNASYPLSLSETNTFWPMYSQLSTALTNKGIRDAVGISGPETQSPEYYGPNIKTYVLDPSPGTQQFGQVIDQVVIHDYDSFFDYDPRGFNGNLSSRTLSYMMNIMNDIKTSVSNTYISIGKTAPAFFLGEIGNSGYNGGYVDNKSGIADGGLYSAEETIRGLAEGYDGILRWNLTTTTQAPMPRDVVLRPIFFDRSSKTFTINGASYYSGAVISRYMTRGSSVYNFSITGAGDPQRVFAAPLKGTDGEWTVFLINDDFVERQVDLDLSALGITNGTMFNEFEWSAGNPNGVHCAQTLAYMGRKLNIPLQPRSVMAFTMRGDTEFIQGAMLTVDEQFIDGVVSNNGFENGTLNPWVNVSNASVVKYTDGTCHSGNYLAKLTTSSSDGELKQTVNNMKTGNYTLTAYARTEGNGHSAKIAVKINGSEVNSASTTNSSWTKLSVPFTVPTGTSTIEVVGTSPYKLGTTWAQIDDVGISPNFITNSGFETGSLSGWTASNAAAENSTTWANTGSYFATLNISYGDSEIYQTVSNLTPGNYILKAHVRTSGNNTACVGVRNFDGSKDYSQDVNSFDYRTVSIPFTIPSGGSSVTVYANGAYTSAGWVNLDDFEILPIEGLLNGGFETGTPLLWTITGNAAREAGASNAHSGTSVATLNTSWGSGSFSQTITGLTPGTYSFSGYVYCGVGVSAGLRVGGYGGSDVQVSTSNPYWTRLAVDFTIPNGYNSATIYYESSGGGTGTWSNGDDFELRPVMNYKPGWISDSVNGYSYIYNHSANLCFYTDNVFAFGSDGSRLGRTTNTAEYCIYRAPANNDMKGFATTTWFWAGEAIQDFKFYTSPDNITYTRFTPSSRTVAANWNEVIYEGDSLPTGTKYLKIEFNNGTVNYWNAQLGAVDIFY